jgi:L-malate glycosyltransferase
MNRSIIGIGSWGWARDVYRLLTYDPLATAREARELRSALRDWQGDHLFNFPYFGIGGAERVHADIVSAIKEKGPLVIISGFSGTAANRPAFEASAKTIAVPRALHHPFTRSKAHARIAAALNAKKKPVLFASLSAVFFDLLPALGAHVRCHYLQHAFLYQPEGNTQHKQWLGSFPRLETMLFVSGEALKEYDRFLSGHQVPQAQRKKLQLMPNAVHRFGQVHAHARIGVLFVGRDSEEKRLPVFLAVAKRLHETMPQAFQFTVVGAEDKKVAGVRFTGAIADTHELARIYGAHSVLVVTSYREGFPMVIMEAMAQGCAILTTPVGDVPNRLEPDVAAITSTVDAEQVVLEMTERLMAFARDTTALLAMRQAALAQAKRDFGMDAFVARYRELLIGNNASI